jgi:hypothetical protein
VVIDTTFFVLYLHDKKFIKKFIETDELPLAETKDMSGNFSGANI